jgi:hypothetical protein
MIAKVGIHVWAISALLPIFLSGIAYGYGWEWSKHRTWQQYHKIEWLHVLSVLIPLVGAMVLIFLGMFEYAR